MAEWARGARVLPAAAPRRPEPAPGPISGPPVVSIAVRRNPGVEAIRERPGGRAIPYHRALRTGTLRISDRSDAPKPSPRPTAVAKWEALTLGSAGPPSAQASAGPEIPSRACGLPRFRPSLRR